MKKVSKLILPNDPAYIEALLSYSAALCSRAGFSGKETGEFSIAIKEACENVIMHAFDPYEDEMFTVTFEVFDDGVGVVIDEMGLPFSLKSGDEMKQTPGLRVIEANVDRVVFVNRGKEGKELQLYKYFKGRHVEEIFTADELKPYDFCEIPERDGNFTTRLMRPDEALEVSRCIYRAYRYTYLNEDLYFPERIEAKNRDGRMISAVAVTEADEVVAHFALLPRPNGEVAEIGVAVVVPKYRGRGLMKTLLDFLISTAGERGFKALYGNAFTMHDLSQRTNLKFGFHETALQLGVLPPHSIAPLTERGLKGAGHVMTFFKYLGRPARYSVYLPDAHREMLLEIYSGLGVEREFMGPKDFMPYPVREESEIHLTTKPTHKTATIVVKSLGPDIETRVKAKRLELGDKGFNTIYLDLNLADPLTPWAERKLSNIGFFFSGLLVDFTDGDVLRLQYYMTEVDYDEIETASPFAIRLVEYVRSLDPKWKAMHPD